MEAVGRSEIWKKELKVCKEHHRKWNCHSVEGSCALELWRHSGCPLPGRVLLPSSVYFQMQCADNITGTYKACQRVLEETESQGRLSISNVTETKKSWPLSWYEGTWRKADDGLKREKPMHWSFKWGWRTATEETSWKEEIRAGYFWINF